MVAGGHSEVPGRMTTGPVSLQSPNTLASCEEIDGLRLSSAAARPQAVGSGTELALPAWTVPLRLRTAAVRLGCGFAALRSLAAISARWLPSANPRAFDFASEQSSRRDERR